MGNTPNTLQINSLENNSQINLALQGILHSKDTFLNAGYPSVALVPQVCYCQTLKF